MKRILLYTLCIMHIGICIGSNTQATQSDIPTWDEIATSGKGIISSAWKRIMHDYDNITPINKAYFIGGACAGIPLLHFAHKWIWHPVYVGTIQRLSRSFKTSLDKIDELSWIDLDQLNCKTTRDIGRMLLNIEDTIQESNSYDELFTGSTSWHEIYDNVSRAKRWIHKNKATLQNMFPHGESTYFLMNMLQNSMSNSSSTPQLNRLYNTPQLSISQGNYSFRWLSGSANQKIMNLYQIPREPNINKIEHHLRSIKQHAEQFIDTPHSYLSWTQSIRRMYTAANHTLYKWTYGMLTGERIGIGAGLGLMYLYSDSINNGWSYLMNTASTADASTITNTPNE